MSKALRVQQRNQRQETQASREHKDNLSISNSRTVPILEETQPRSRIFCSFASLGACCVRVHVSLCTRFKRAHMYTVYV